MDQKMPNLSYRGLTTVSRKTIKILVFFNWIPRSSRGMTAGKSIHTGII
ncbi:hypothetical protein [Candidatus Rickettsia colombianensi]|nr:hypothetical protein [Candidatus Rickettsia colombianensi]